MPGKFVAPTYEKLHLAVKSIVADYTEEKSSPHTQQVAYLQALNPEPPSYAYEHEVLVGACIFILLCNKHDKSEFTKQLKKALGLDPEKPEDKIDNRAEFKYLMLFYKFCKASIPESLKSQAKNIMLESRRKVAPELMTILKRLPTYSALNKGIKEIRQRYESECSQESKIWKALSYLYIGGHSANRLEAISILESVNDGQHNHVLPSQAIIPQDYNFQQLLGTAIGLQIEIAIEYQCSFLSASRSKLYQNLRRLTNIDNLADLDKTSVKNDLVKVLAYISSIAAKRQKNIRWEEYGLDTNKIQDQWVQILVELNNKKVDFLKNDKLNALLNQLCDTIATTATQLGIAGALAEVAALLLCHGLNISHLFYLLNPTYAALAIGALVVMGSGIYSLVGPSIAQKLGMPLKPFISTIIKAPLDGVTALSNWLFAIEPAVMTSEEQDDFARDYFNADSSICPQDEKERVGMLFEEEVLNMPPRLFEQENGVAHSDLSGSVDMGYGK